MVFHLFSTVFHYVGIYMCFMDTMHRLMTKISDAVRRKVLRKSLYPPTANMNFLRNPSVLIPPFFSFLRVTVMTDRRTKYHFRYSGTEAPVKEKSPLLLQLSNVSVRTLPTDPLISSILSLSHNPILSYNLIMSTLFLCLCVLRHKPAGAPKEAVYPAPVARVQATPALL